MRHIHSEQRPHFILIPLFFLLFSDATWGCRVLADKIEDPSTQEWLGILHSIWSLVKVGENMMILLTLLVRWWTSRCGHCQWDHQAAARLPISPSEEEVKNDRLKYMWYVWGEIVAEKPKFCFNSCKGQFLVNIAQF